MKISAFFILVSVVLAGVAIFLIYKTYAASPANVTDGYEKKADTPPSIDTITPPPYYTIIESPPPGSPKAVVVRLPGNHIVNLAKHPGQNIEPIESLSNFGDLPVWISHPVDTADPDTFQVFWQIEPMGEYLYYLAGDYPKNEKGLLLFGSMQTEFIVNTNFEDDVIDVSKQDGAMYQNMAENAVVKADQILPLKISETKTLYENALRPEYYALGYVDLSSNLPSDVNGWARLEINESRDKKTIKATLIYETFRAPVLTGEYERLTIVMASSNDPNVKLQDLMEHFIDLVKVYHDMPYVPVSGSIRM